MSSYGMVHLITAFLAIAAGAVVLRLPKGTRWHRTFGHLYAMSMLGVITTSFAIYGLTGSPGPFHFAALVAAVALGGGMITVLFRRPKKGWIEAHAIWMSSRSLNGRPVKPIAIGSPWTAPAGRTTLG